MEAQIFKFDCSSFKHVFHVDFNAVHITDFSCSRDRFAGVLCKFM